MAEWPRHVFQDWKSNKGRPLIQLSLALFRTAQRTRMLAGRRSIPDIAVTLVYRWVSRGIVSMDLPVAVQVGPGLQIHHGMALVVHPGSTIGANVILRHSITIGVKSASGAPEIGDRVDIGAGAQVIGPVRLGQGSRVGAGCVVLADVPPNGTVVGNPGRLLPTRGAES